jgi:capsule biosynthesis phosphatase
MSYDKTKHLVKKLSIDFDGTICENKKPGEGYEDVKPKPGAIEALKELKAQGFDIVIHTARNMATCNNNVAKATARQAPIIYEWCKKYDCPYDELLFGKPHVDFIIDDKAIEFTNWKDTKKILYSKLDKIGDSKND